MGQITSALPSGCTPGVYLYSGAITKPEDMNSNASSHPNQPLASKAPVATSMPPYFYQFTALAAGSYTLALTCQAAQDDPANSDSSVMFSPSLPAPWSPPTRRRWGTFPSTRSGRGRLSHAST
jgi:hypothetical protein